MPTAVPAASHNGPIRWEILALTLAFRVRSSTLAPTPIRAPVRSVTWDATPFKAPETGFGTSRYSSFSRPGGRGFRAGLHPPGAGGLRTGQGGPAAVPGLGGGTTVRSDYRS